MRATLFPATGIHFKPAFWGVERDLADVLNRMESIWDGRVAPTTHSYAEFQETEKAYLVAIDMPGVSKNELSLELAEDRVLINGTRKRPFAESEAQPEKVSRMALLPQDVDRDKIQAHMEDGVLYLALPKVEKPKPKKIELTEGPKANLWSKLLGEKTKLVS